MCDLCLHRSDTSHFALIAHNPDWAGSHRRAALDAVGTHAPQKIAAIPAASEEGLHPARVASSRVTTEAAHEGLGKSLSAQIAGDHRLRDGDRHLRIIG